MGMEVGTKLLADCSWMQLRTKYGSQVPPHAAHTLPIMAPHPHHPKNCQATLAAKRRPCPAE
eukprot:2590123-Prorocentrum_lima.AAC.1